MKNSNSKALIKNNMKLTRVISAVVMAAIVMLAVYGWSTIAANAAPANLPVSSSAMNATPIQVQKPGVLPKYTTQPNIAKTSGNYLMTTTNYTIDDKVVLTVNLFYRKDGDIYRAVYYNAVSADGKISFSERDIYDTIIYVNDDNIGLAKGQTAYYEIHELLREVGY